MRSGKYYKEETSIITSFKVKTRSSNIELRKQNKNETYKFTKQMHLHQPDWKSGEWAVDGGVDAGDHPDGADVPYRWWSWKSGQFKIKSQSN